ncbi:MAG: LptF/LptG family permease, partial [Deltaproteobacteria bacterium]|nr:LptF/LptG family permease [Deltaproteobacteria bacterium]
MTILDRYILREFVRVFALIIVSLVSLYVIVDFFERIRMFISNHATAHQVLTYFVYSVPMILSQMLPVTFFLSTLITFSILSTHNELMAMKASGVSLFRVAVPVIAVSVAVCIASFFLSEYVTPFANEKVKYVKYVEIQKKNKAGTFKQNQIWYKGRDGIYAIAYVDPNRHILKGIRINYLDHKMNLVKRIDAKEARWEQDAWSGTDV